MKNLLSKIQEFPGRERKIIFWVVMIVLALTLFGLYVRYVQKKVADIGLKKTKEELQINSLEEILKKMPNIEIPKIEMPKLDQETLQELEKAIEKTPTEGVYDKPIE